MMSILRKNVFVKSKKNQHHPLCTFNWNWRACRKRGNPVFNNFSLISCFWSSQMKSFAHCTMCIAHTLFSMLVFITQSWCSLHGTSQGFLSLACDWLPKNVRSIYIEGVDYHRRPEFAEMKEHGIKFDTDHRHWCMWETGTWRKHCWIWAECSQAGTCNCLTLSSQQFPLLLVHSCPASFFLPPLASLMPLPPPGRTNISRLTQLKTHKVGNHNHSPYIANHSLCCMYPVCLSEGSFDF